MKSIRCSAFKIAEIFAQKPAILMQDFANFFGFLKNKNRFLEGILTVQIETKNNVERMELNSELISFIRACTTANYCDVEDDQERDLRYITSKDPTFELVWEGFKAANDRGDFIMGATSLYSIGEMLEGYFDEGGMNDDPDVDWD